MKKKSWKENMESQTGRPLARTREQPYDASIDWTGSQERKKKSHIERAS